MTANVFEIGVNSLSAAQIAARAATALGVEAGIRDIFDEPTIAGLAERLAHANRFLGAAAGARPRPERIPLAAAQRRMWFLNQFDTASAAYNICFAARLTGRLDIDALRAALLDVLARHEPLRTMYPAVDGEPCQVVLDVAAMAGESVLDPEPVVDETELAERIRRAVGAGFDIAESAPVRARLYRTGADEHVMVLVVHHIAADGSSMAPLAARCVRRLPGACERLERRNGSRWKSSTPTTRCGSGGARRRGRSGVVDRAADRVLERSPRRRSRNCSTCRPTGRGPPPCRCAAAMCASPCRRGCTTTSCGWRTREGVTVFIVLHAALAMLLARTAHSEDISVGTPVAGRGARALDDLVGMFVNTVVLRTRVRDDRSFRELLARGPRRRPGGARPRGSALRTAGRRPRSSAFDGVYAAVPGDVRVAEHARGSVRAARCRMSNCSIPGIAQAKTDLTVLLTERAEGDRPAGIDGEIVYATDFSSNRPRNRSPSRFIRVLEAVTADPARPVGDIDAARAPRRPGGCSRHAAATPHAAVPASRSAGVGRGRGPGGARPDRGQPRPSPTGSSTAGPTGSPRHLLGQGVGPGVFVALAVPRSVDYHVAMWAIAKTGAAFVPVDLRYPGRPDRAHGAPIPVSPSGSRSRPRATSLPGGVGWLVLDDPRSAAEIAARSDRAVDRRGSPTRAADSGCGLCGLHIRLDRNSRRVCVVTHEGLAGFAAEQRDRYRVDSTSRVLQVAAPAFDAVLLEALMACAAGACLVGIAAGGVRRPGAGGADPHAAGDPRVPDTQCAGDDVAGRTSTRCGCWRSAARWCAADLVAAWAPGRQLHNIYGPTETTIVVTISEPVQPGRRDHDRRADPWCRRLWCWTRGCGRCRSESTGELYLSGAQLARGYLNRPAATAGAFVANPTVSRVRGCIAPATSSAGPRSGDAGIRGPHRLPGQDSRLAHRTRRDRRRAARAPRGGLRGDRAAAAAPAANRCSPPTSWPNPARSSNRRDRARSRRCRTARAHGAGVDHGARPHAAHLDRQGGPKSAAGARLRRRRRRCRRAVDRPANAPSPRSSPEVLGVASVGATTRSSRSAATPSCRSSWRPG